MKNNFSLWSFVKMILSNKTLDSLKLAPKNKRNRILAASRAIIHLLPENESSKIIIRDIDSLRNWSVLSIFGAFVNLGASLRLSSISRERKILEYQNLFFFQVLKIIFTFFQKWIRLENEIMMPIWKGWKHLSTVIIIMIQKLGKKV